MPTTATKAEFLLSKLLWHQRFLSPSPRSTGARQLHIATPLAHAPQKWQVVVILSIQPPRCSTSELQRAVEGSLASVLVPSALDDSPDSSCQANNLQCIPWSDGWLYICSFSLLLLPKYSRLPKTTENWMPQNAGKARLKAPFTIIRA